MDKLRRALSGEQDEEEGGIMTDIDDGISLSWETRIQGFVACFVLGLILSFLGSIMVFWQLWKGFAILVSCGSLVSMASTCFLMGPFRQVKKMFAETRFIATIVFFVMIILTFMAGLWWKKGILCLIFVVCQYLAMAWYSISYIPYARNAVKSCLGACIN